MLRFYEPIVNRLWGYDFFISYNQASAGVYANRLAEELRRRGFDIFLDHDEIAAGDHLSQTIENALRSTRRLVVVATREAICSTWVAKEILLFTSRNRQCIAVTFSDTFEVQKALTSEETRARDILQSFEKLHILEASENLALGRPDKNQVVEKLIASHGIMRRRSLRRTITLITIVVLLALSLFSTVSWINATIARNATREEQRKTKRQVALNEFQLGVQARSSGAELGVCLRFVMLIFIFGSARALPEISG